MKKFLTKSVAGLLAAAFVGFSLPVAAEEVLVVTWRGKTDAEKGFENRLKSLHPSVKFSHVDAGRNKSKLAEDLRKLDYSKIKLVYTFGTTGSKMAKTILKGKVPQVFNIVSAPIRSKLVKSFEAPGENITGVRHIVDLETQFNIMNKIKKIKKVAIWFDPREKNTVALMKRMSELSKKHGKTYKTMRVIADADNFAKMVKAASEESRSYDVVYIPSSSGYIAKADQLFSNLDKSLLVFGAVNKFVGKGATVALAADYKERGEAAAELANKILKGTSAGQLPVNLVTDKTARLYVDSKLAPKAGLSSLEALGLGLVKK